MSPDITLISVFVAGLLSFISPCVLPLVPPYLTYLAGVSLEELTSTAEREAIEQRNALRWKVFTNAALFVAGFSVVFTSLGAGASTIGTVIRQYQDVLATIAGIIIIIMGLHFLGVFRIGLLYREARFQLSNDTLRGASLGGSFLMGLAFAFGWTPCIGPVLGSVLGVASSRETVGEGAGLLFLYSMGLGVPFLLAAFFAEPFMRFLNRFKRHLGTVEKIMGALLVLTGILFITGQMQAMSYALLEAFPFLQELG